MPKEAASVECDAVPWVGGVLPLALGSGLHDLGRSSAGQSCEDEGTSLGQVPGPCRHVYETDRQVQRRSKRRVDQSGSGSPARFL